MLYYRLYFVFSTLWLHILSLCLTYLVNTLRIRKIQTVDNTALAVILWTPHTNTYQNGNVHVFNYSRLETNMALPEMKSNDSQCDKLQMSVQYKVRQIVRCWFFYKCWLQRLWRETKELEPINYNIINITNFGFWNEHGFEQTFFIANILTSISRKSTGETNVNHGWVPLRSCLHGPSV